ncbi:MAG: cyclic nucleotide-binding domain-containing protein [Actinobacteria bacterium]|nr:cyclic nucleotide-binding domain-containing protein [Actinomycetota bacterium]MBV9664190.1 cyclic nucleotide-binding domain-containing protein [Actinomycetota bacterium]
MRIESSVTSISWIPSEAIKGMTKMPFEVGVAHYDQPPPDVVDDLVALRDADRFRFANNLTAWIEVEDGRITDYGQGGSGIIGATHMRFGPKGVVFAAIPFPEIVPEPEVTGSSVRFIQTAGGRPGMPAPRRVSKPPFVQIEGPVVWVTLALTLHADGSSEHEVVGASTFPRHWIYDASGKLVQKSGTIDFKTWYRESFDQHSPWGDEQTPALVTAVETALERELSTKIMRGGAKPKIRKLTPGETLTEQGSPGHEMFMLIDGVLSVEVDGEALADLGPGAVLGERAVLEGGTRTSTLRAVTNCKVAVAEAADIDTAALEELSTGHKREEG